MGQLFKEVEKGTGNQHTKVKELSGGAPTKHTRTQAATEAGGKGYNIILAKRGGDRRSEEFISNNNNIILRKVTIKTRLRNKE